MYRLLYTFSGHPHRPSSLYGLAFCLSDRYSNRGVAADLDGAVTFRRAALALRPPGHPDRTPLELYPSGCLDRPSSLQLRSPRHPDRGVSLYNIAWDLWRRFPKYVIWTSYTVQHWNCVPRVILIGLHLSVRLLFVCQIGMTAME